MYTLDLHGYKIDETHDVVDSFLYDHKLYNTKRVEIITGDSKVIKTVVAEIAENYGFTCKPHIYNKEVLTISV
jgi:DNA-nicking Smr family endonuclease